MRSTLLSLLFCQLHAASKPNFVFILTDDQDAMLSPSLPEYLPGDDKSLMASLQPMPFVRDKMIKEGARLKNFFVATPICCPSRTEFFTGR